MTLFETVKAYMKLNRPFEIKMHAKSLSLYDAEHLQKLGVEIEYSKNMVIITNPKRNGYITGIMNVCA